jgi:hypothetical protein
MSHYYNQSKELYIVRIRVPKDDAYFVYFTFEANEGLCYYSTVDESLGSSYRDIDVRCSIEWRENLKLLIQRIQTELRLDVLDEKIILDS